MATSTLAETEVPAKSGTKYVYSFGGGKADGDGKMKDVLGGKGAGLAEMTNAGFPCLRDSPFRPKPVVNTCAGMVSRKPWTSRWMPPSSKLEDLAGTATRQGRKSAAGERSLGREVLHARHDGYDSEPRPERPERRSAGQAQQQSALRLRLLSPSDSDVRQRGARNPQVSLRRSFRPARNIRRKPSSIPTSMPRP